MAAFEAKPLHAAKADAELASASAAMRAEPGQPTWWQAWPARAEPLKKTDADRPAPSGWWLVPAIIGGLLIWVWVLRQLVESIARML